MEVSLVVELHFFLNQILKDGVCFDIPNCGLC